MYLDASAIIAVLTNESDAEEIIAKLEQATAPIYCSPLTVFEATISLARKITSEQASDQAPIPPEIINMSQQDIDDFLEVLQVQEMAINNKTYRLAVKAAQTFGKFVAHPARLNMGDCFVYACAKEYNLPLLFKGDDFSRTDIDAV